MRRKFFLLGGLFRASNLRAFPGKVQGMIRPGELLCAAPVRCVPRVSRKGLLLRTRGRASIVERSDRLTMMPRHVIKCLPSRMRGEACFGSVKSLTLASPRMRRGTSWRHTFRTDHGPHGTPWNPMEPHNPPIPLNKTLAFLKKTFRPSPLYP